MRNAPKVRLLVATMLLTPCALGQLGTRSVSELIASLTSAERPHGTNPIIGFATCGVTQEVVRERAVARELGSRGKATVPELDRVLGSIERDGEDSAYFERSGWFLFAYARAQGPASVSRLMRMMRSPKLDSLHISLDRAIALSLGLTSYVSSGRKGGPLFFICRRQEPKDALDEFLLALERGDRSELESSVGPKGRMALDRLLAGRSWETVYQELWHTSAGGDGALGYLFDIRGRWSEPEETLEENRDDGDDPLIETEVALDTRFKTNSGKDCARYLVRFNKVSQFGRARYLVDNTNLGDLISSVGVCFTQQ